MIEETRGICKLCYSKNIIEVSEFRSLPRVTSDCRPWRSGGNLFCCQMCSAIQKTDSTTWLEEIKNIYQEYTLSPDLGGAAQPIFYDDKFLSRASIMAEYLEKNVRLPAQTRCLDFGCGAGPLLRTFSDKFPQWTLFGFDIECKFIDEVESIKGLEKLYLKSFNSIEGKFDLITLIHSLEHVIDPRTTLRLLADRIKPNGTILINVPNAEVSPYDLVVTDHLLHFSVTSLKYLANNVGLSSKIISDSKMSKEITGLFSPLPPYSKLCYAQDKKVRDSIQNVRIKVGWLRSQIEQLKKICGSSKRVGLFGTGNSASWLFGPFKRKVEFFIDEDVQKHGKTHLGRPIYSPAQIPMNSDVYVPLLPDYANQVVNRLSSKVSAVTRFHTPVPINST